MWERHWKDHECLAGLGCADQHPEECQQQRGRSVCEENRIRAQKHFPLFTWFTHLSKELNEALEALESAGALASKRSQDTHVYLILKLGAWMLFWNF